MSTVEETVCELEKTNARFHEIVEEKLEDFVGIEFTVAKVDHRPEKGTYYVYVEPVGISKDLSDEFGDIAVSTRGQLNFEFDVSELKKPDDEDDHPGQGRGPE